MIMKENVKIFTNFECDADNTGKKIFIMLQHYIYVITLITICLSFLAEAADLVLFIVDHRDTSYGRKGLLSTKHHTE